MNGEGGFLDLDYGSSMAVHKIDAGGSLALTETTWWEWSANMFLGCLCSNLEMSDGFV